MNVVELDESLFERFKDLIYSEAGIKLSDLKKALVQARLSRRIRALHLSSYHEYHRYLVENYQYEKIHFINAITTNKTDFFREDKHFRYMTEVCLPEFAALGRREIKIWSAGCSTGEEPYSIAMTLEEYREHGRALSYKILATDIDTNVLETGTGGVYSYDRLVDVDVGLLKKYFYRGSGENEGLFKVKEGLRRSIHFKRLNLLDDRYPMKGKFDIIFCRNVIIYFDKPTQTRLFAHLAQCVEDHGYLFIGHSENITGISDRFRLMGHTIYRKADGPGRAAAVK